MTSGIYKITSVSRKKEYIGSAVDIAARRRLHFHQLRTGKHHSKKLQRAFDISGEKDFVFSEIIICSPGNLLMYEQIAIDSCRPWFNSALVAGSKLGCVASIETRKKLSDSHIGQKLSEERKEKLRAAAKAWAATDKGRHHLKTAALGRKQSQEEKERRASSLRGKKRSGVALENIRSAQKNRSDNRSGENNGTAKMTDIKVIEMRLAFASGEKCAELSRRYGIHKKTASSILKRTTWKHLP